MSQPRWHADLATEAATETPGGYPITVLRDPSDDARVTHALLGAHDLAHGVITVHPTPTAVSGSALAADTLAALGCCLARASTEQVATTDAASRAVLAWIHADRIRHLVVLRAHTLTADQLAWLLRLRRSSSVRLVLNAALPTASRAGTKSSPCTGCSVPSSPTAPAPTPPSRASRVCAPRSNSTASTSSCRRTWPTASGQD
ncbi:hypothetical protein [Nocardia sp. bgisy134]|uniref:hypothetical protein n=1 Tax=Nocardia sp. bgisy134 TaxID=3413789 RepID=UPI003D715981